MVPRPVGHKILLKVWLLNACFWSYKPLTNLRHGPNYLPDAIRLHVGRRARKRTTFGCLSETSAKLTLCANAYLIHKNTNALLQDEILEDCDVLASCSQKLEILDALILWSPPIAHDGGVDDQQICSARAERRHFTPLGDVPAEVDALLLGAK
jgi:hypothetical protein